MDSMFEVGASRSLLLGIAGGTGSGKTTLARKIGEALGQSSTLISHDWYYLDRTGYTPEQREAINYDEPAALDNALLASHLDELRQSRGVECPQYDFATHTRRAESVSVPARHVVVVEGILLFAVPALRNCFDLRLFVDTDDDIRLLRRIRRDVVDPGRGLHSGGPKYTGGVSPKT